MVLFRNEQLPNRTLRPGDRIKVLVTDIRHTVRGPWIMLSRTHPALIRRLFELEIPEIADGTVEIKSLAREAGSRTKIAVLRPATTRWPRSAPASGWRAARKNAVAAELCGEKIDIIPYKELTRRIHQRCAGAGNGVVGRKAAGQRPQLPRYRQRRPELSLAIGREGQNARLAAKLTGLKIDIKGDRSLRGEEEPSAEA